MKLKVQIWVNGSLFRVETGRHGIIIIFSSIGGHVRLELRVLFKLVQQVVLTSLIKFYLLG